MALTLLRRPVQKPRIGAIGINIGHPLTRGLVGGWLHNEGGGTVLNNLTGPAGNASIVAQNASGNGSGVWGGVDRGPDLIYKDTNGTTYTDIPASVLTSINGGPISTVVMLRVDSQANFAPAFFSTPNRRWSVYCDTTTHMFLEAGTAVAQSLTISAFSLGVYYLWVFVYDGATYTVYRDGVQAGQMSVAGGTTYTDELRMGWHSSVGSDFVGRQSLVYLYNRALTQNEAAQLTLEPYGFVQVRPVQRWLVVAGGTNATVTAPSAKLGTVQAPVPLVLPQNASASEPATWIGTVATRAPSVSPTPSAPGGFGDVSFRFNPYVWRTAATYYETNESNATIEFEFQSDSLALDVDVTSFAAVTTTEWPGISWSLDRGAWTSFAKPNSGTNISGNIWRMTIGTGLATSGAWHHVKIFTAWNTSHDRWTTMLLRVLQFVKTTGAGLDASRAPTYTWSKNLVTFGDSTMEWVDPGATIGQWNWPLTLARGLGCNVGNVSFAGTGWRVGAAGVPQFNSPGDATNQSWRNYSSGQSRLSGGVLSPLPDYALVSFGVNDAGGSWSSANIQAAASDWLTNFRTAAGANCHIFVLVPFGQFYQSAFAAAVAASGDARVHLIDLGVEMSLGLTGAGGSSWRSGDTTHPNLADQAEIAARLVGAIRDAIGGVIRPLEVI